jgi:hypothetical protein
MAECPHCEYNKKRAQNWRVEAYRLAGHPLPEPEWVDLTDDEMLMIYGQQHEGKKYSLGRMVQQALKEKNT